MLDKLKQMTQSKLKTAIIAYIGNKGELPNYDAFGIEAENKEKMGTTKFKEKYSDTIIKVIGDYLDNQNESQLKTKLDALLSKFTDKEKDAFFEKLSKSYPTHQEKIEKIRSKETQTLEKEEDIKISADTVKSNVLDEVTNTNTITKAHFERLITARVPQEGIISVIKSGLSIKAGSTALQTYIETAIAHKQPLNTALFQNLNPQISVLVDGYFINAFAKGAKELEKVYATFPNHLTQENKDAQFHLATILKKLIDEDKDNTCTAFNNAIKALSEPPEAHALLIGTLKTTDFPSHICAHIDQLGVFSNKLEAEFTALDNINNKQFGERNAIAEKADKYLSGESKYTTVNKIKQFLIDKTNSIIDAKDAKLDAEGNILTSMDATLKLCDDFKKATDVDEKITLKKQAEEKIAALQKDTTIPPEFKDIQIKALEESFDIRNQEALDAAKKSVLEQFSANIATSLPKDILFDVINQTTKNALKMNLRATNTAIIIGGFLNPLKEKFNEGHAGQNVAILELIRGFLNDTQPTLTPNAPTTIEAMENLLMAIDFSELQAIPKKFELSTDDDTSLSDIAEKLLQKIKNKEIENKIISIAADEHKSAGDQCKEINELLNNGSFEEYEKQEIAMNVAQKFADSMKEIETKQFIPEYFIFINTHRPTILNDTFQEICDAPTKEKPVPDQLSALLNMDFSEKYKILNDYIGNLHLESQLQLLQKLSNEHQKNVDISKIKFSTLGLTEQLDTLSTIKDTEIQKALLPQLNLENSALQRIAEKITPEYFRNFFRLKEESGEKLQENMQFLRDPNKFERTIHKLEKTEDKLDNKIKFFSVLKSILYLISQSIFSGVLEKAGAQKNDLTEARDQTEKLYAITTKLYPEIANQASFESSKGPSR